MGGQKCGGEREAEERQVRALIMRTRGRITLNQEQVPRARGQEKSPRIKSYE